MTNISVDSLLTFLLFCSIFIMIPNSKKVSFLVFRLLFELLIVVIAGYVYYVYDRSALVLIFTVLTLLLLIIESLLLYRRDRW